ncbi:hypothetical protein B0J11DRAFT_306480 [Dendryphion nanum]|uniref:Uncharacterized protein n=1 Tax=Dendryphion nanum TaxID=256645 RepID=A0A9P9DU35_9PLEO|nr:hypothetical protein B0J11DRAFT_306480 [Dendryphion nanum]
MKLINSWISASLLLVCLFAWLCIDVDMDFDVDYSHTSSLFGPGAYTAWVINLIDYSWDEWCIFVSNMSSASPWPIPLYVPKTAIKNQETPLRKIQRATGIAYFVAMVLWAFLSPIFVGGEWLPIFNLQILCFVGRTVYALSLPYDPFWLKLPISLLFPGSILRIIGSAGGAWLWVSGFYTSYLPMLFWFCWLEPRQHGTITILNKGQFAIAGTLLHWAGHELFYQMVIKRNAIRFNGPWPRSNVSLWELDQLFAISVACAYFLLPRWKHIKTFAKRTSGSGSWRVFRRFRRKGTNHQGIITNPDHP